MLRPMIAAALAISVTACASEPPRREFRHHGGPPPGGAGHGRRGVFISPSGEPFRGGDGLAAWFAQADADHDGAITAAEFQADAERFFQRLDANHDGVVDGLELSAYEQSIAPEIAAMDIDRQPSGGEGAAAPRRGGGMGGGRRGGRGRMGGGGFGGGDGRGSAAGGGRESGGRYALINDPEPVANADENVDGKVSLEEWRHAASRRFALLDKAKTGRLTLEELRGKAPKRTQ
jgi:hypothetical protein